MRTLERPKKIEVVPVVDFESHRMADIAGLRAMGYLTDATDTASRYRSFDNDRKAMSAMQPFTVILHCTELEHDLAARMAWREFGDASGACRDAQSLRPACRYVLGTAKTIMRFKMIEGDLHTAQETVYRDPGVHMHVGDWSVLLAMKTQDPDIYLREYFFRYKYLLEDFISRLPGLQDDPPLAYEPVDLSWGIYDFIRQGWLMKDGQPHLFATKDEADVAVLAICAERSVQHGRLRPHVYGGTKNMVSEADLTAC